MESYDRYPNPRRFYRSSNRVIAGVCGGIADRMGWDPTIVRITAVVMFLSGFLSGMIFLAYIIAWMVTPNRPFSVALSPEEDSFWRGVSDRPRVTLSNIRYAFKDLDERLQGLEKSVTSEDWRLRRQFRDLEN